MQTVYRIEHAESEHGPYNHCYADDKPAVLYTHSEMQNHPNALYDGLSWITNEYLFGFTSLDDLFAWFNDCILDLYAYGFVIAEYKSIEIIHGKSKKQVVFIPQHKEVVHDMMELADSYGYKGV